MFSEIGMFLDLGLAKGITDHSNVLYDAAEALGDDTADGIGQSWIVKSINLI